MISIYSSSSQSLYHYHHHTGLKRQSRCCSPLPTGAEYHYIFTIITIIITTITPASEASLDVPPLFPQGQVHKPPSWQTLPPHSVKSVPQKVPHNFDLAHVSVKSVSQKCIIQFNSMSVNKMFQNKCPLVRVVHKGIAMFH